MQGNSSNKEDTEINMPEIKLSVRNLVEFILVSGDIDNRRGTGMDVDAMQLGSKMHRKIQKQMDLDYRAEVPLTIRLDRDDFVLIIEGRADGIITKGDCVTIDEIKSSYMDLDNIKEPILVHQAQAMCYGYIYGIQNELTKLTIQMTYCNLETEAVKRYQTKFTMEDLTEWFLGIVKSYEKWAKFQIDWRMTREASIKELEFPFQYRSGQKDLVSAVYRTILRKKNLFVQAPTGVGKTISTVFPAIRAVGEKLGDKVFYLTAKTITRTVAQETFQLLSKQGLSYKVLVITAKDKMCLCEEVECNPEYCSYAKGHFDRVNDAVFETVTTTNEFTRESILAAAKKYHVCPFEFCLDLSLWVDAIICDYNYVFDPNVRLKRFFAEGIKGDYIFLIDEAHNLIDRGREMYSAKLYKEDFMAVKNLIKPYSTKLKRYLDSCNKAMLELKRECDTYQVLSDAGHFAIQVMNVMVEIEKFLDEMDEVEVTIKKSVSALYLECRNFINIFERLDENYVIYTDHETDGRFMLKLLCVDTAKNIQECLDRGKSTIFFSATLLPIQYYKSMLSTRTDDYAIYVNTTFKDEQKLLLISRDVSSKYTRRNLSEYERMAAYIEYTVAGKKGNYMVFFPSFRLMADVYECYMKTEQSSEIICLTQSSNMSEYEREEFLRYFLTKQDQSVVGFCVMGGIFAEGIDLKYDALIGVIIVGTGLPQVCNEREILKNYFDHKDGGGFNYGYLYPGMNKVLQSAGRVIRTTEDRGIILLLDERFTMNQYRKLFPKEWADHKICRLPQITQEIAKFWQEDVNI